MLRTHMNDNTTALLTDDELHATAHSYCFTCKARPGTYCTVDTPRGRIRLADHPAAAGGAHTIRVTTWQFRSDDR
jgi:hypothetical protein